MAGHLDNKVPKWYWLEGHKNHFTIKRYYVAFESFGKPAEWPF